MKCLKFITILSVLFTGGLCAHIHPSAGGFALDAEFLYLLPSVDDTYFVIDSSNITNPSGSRENNNLGFQPGFRVGGIYGFCDCNSEFSVYYSRLRATQSRTVTGTNLFATVGRPDFADNFDDFTGTASSSLGFLYQRVDGFYGQQLFCNCGLDFSALAGIEFAYLRLSENIEYAPLSAASGTVYQKSRTWGVGPQFGFEADYNVWQCASCLPGTLAVTTFTTGSILAAQTKEQAQNTVAGVSLLDVSDEQTWRVIPAFHARVGLNYTTSCFSCFGASLEVGYEFNTYLRGLTRLVNPDDVADGATFNNYYNFDTQGLYVAVDVSF